MDPRHNTRVKIVQELFSLGFTKQKKLDAKTVLIVKNQKGIEDAIRKHAPKFPIDKIAKVDLAILSLAVYELILEKKEPPKVVINEAVDLAREMGSDKAYAFVNAVLGKIYNDNNKI
ncbi:MAG: N utilization substance protein B-like protein [Candidatus Roizmanbacteria bacterium GW2011_GWA2_35_8]|uniref:N utilization substance protein B-like protein n=1 Tax=Candidatus Roizmanbacteria bacterium GW2011_GWA2_35_8 TaxID=1618479 RepID=A0A0G0FH55_9BACT|nr:MAG: N utilization substance protein B-like protein [Candidatus Roizmanbacteria bacterium GW2011_GWA2_35_8]